MTPAKSTSSHTTWEQLSSRDFASIGMGNVAYIRTVKLDGQTAYVIHAADGSQITAMANHEAAVGVILQNDLELAPLH